MVYMVKFDGCNLEYSLTEMEMILIVQFFQADNIFPLPVSVDHAGNKTGTQLSGIIF